MSDTHDDSTSPGPPELQLDDGTFDLIDPGQSGSPLVGWAWRNGAMSTEIWALHRMNQPGGFRQPGEDHPNVTVEFQFRGVLHADQAAFLQHVESMNPSGAGTRDEITIMVHSFTVM